MLYPSIRKEWEHAAGMAGTRIKPSFPGGTSGTPAPQQQYIYIYMYGGKRNLLKKIKIDSSVGGKVSVQPVFIRILDGEMRFTSAFELGKARLYI